MTHTYALVNQKGGVGKTTTAISLASFIAEGGLRVLLVDLDPQANATACLGITQSQIDGGIYDVLIGGRPVQEMILHNARLNLSLLPATPALAGAQVELVNVTGRENVLAKALAPLDGRYDYILIDCPPSLGLLTVNALVAADGVLVPVQCEYLALEGLSSLVGTLQRARTGLAPRLALRGIALTMFDSRTHLSQDVVEEVRRHFPGQVFRTVIPRSVRLAEAPSHGLPISAYDPRSSGGLAYRALTRELLGGDGVRAKSKSTPAAEVQG